MAEATSIRLKPETVSILSAMQTDNWYRNRTHAIDECVRAWYQSVRSAWSALAAEWDRPIWCYLADTLNGYMWNEVGAFPQFIAMEVSDAHALNRLGDKWFTDSETADAITIGEVTREQADARNAVNARVSALVQRIAAMTIAEAFAVQLIMVRFWDHLHIDAMNDPWWMPDFVAPDLPTLEG